MVGLLNLKPAACTPSALASSAMPKTDDRRNEPMTNSAEIEGRHDDRVDRTVRALLGPAAIGGVDDGPT